MNDKRMYLLGEHLGVGVVAQGLLGVEQGVLSLVLDGLLQRLCWLVGWLAQAEGSANTAQSALRLSCVRAQ